MMDGTASQMQRGKYLSREDVARRQAEGMRAMTHEEMAQAQLLAAPGMAQRGEYTALEIAGMQNIFKASGAARESERAVVNRHSWFQRLKGVFTR